MAKIPSIYASFNGGIADFPSSSSIPNSYAFGRSIDVRSDPNNLTALPRTIKESGTIIQALPKFAETYDPTVITYVYDEGGNLYSRTSAGSSTLLFTVADSHGNGLVYSAEDDNLYIAGDSLIGKYGPLSSSSPTFVADFLGAQGGIPLNTNSLDLEASSSQYASRADTASLSITGDIAIDMQIKPESLPTVGNTMTLVSKWDESGVTRSYKFDISAVSGYFGDGSDGALTILSSATEAPIDSACTATAGTQTITATNTSFASDQIILIHQTRGVNAGQWERAVIQSYVAGTITTTTPIVGTYTTGAQVRVLKQYTNVTINAGAVYSAKAWDGTVGGILGFLYNGTLSGAGTINAAGLGYRGGAAGANAINTTPSGQQGEGTLGLGSSTFTGYNSTSNYNPNTSGGGGGTNGSSPQNAGAGAGGGNGSVGTNATTIAGSTAGLGGLTSGSADLTTITPGGGGGGGAGNNNDGGAGGNGGGILFLIGITHAFTGTITADGLTGLGTEGGGGGGAGGSILIKCQTAVLGAATITANGGTGGATRGGAGGSGRIHLDYLTSYTGTTTPTLNATQDNSLITNTQYQLRLALSSNGTTTETLTKIASVTTDIWQQVGVSWDASASTAEFVLNGNSLGTSIGTFTSIHNNASTFQIGMYKNGAGSATSFYDGLIDEVRLFNTTVATAYMFSNIATQIAPNTVGLVAYYKLNGDYVDATANANTLTATNTPVFSSDVPFASPTTRLDIDQSANTTGDTYALTTGISEAAAHKLTFTPTKDPQKSIQFNIAAIGTGNWTVVIHDVNNNTLASVTIPVASLHTGDYEFIFSSVWRVLTNFTNDYHAHIYSTVADGTIVSGTNNDLETADFITYFQFLVTDTEWHTAARFLNFWVMCNERYLAKYEAPLYEANRLVFGAGYRARALGYWREYLAIGVMRGARIDQTESGRIYFWDGASKFFNFFVDVPEGGINALLGSRGKLYIWAGYKNQLLVYEGGDSASKVRDMPNIESTAYSEIYPQGVTMWQSLIRYAVGGSGDSETLQKGVYTYGSTSNRYPEILTYDYPISTGNYDGSGVRIGLLHVVNKKLLIGWGDGTGYGIDNVSLANAPFQSSLIQFLIDDVGDIVREKQAMEVTALSTPLLTGESMQLAYSLEGNSTFTVNPDIPAVGDKQTKLIISDSRYNEAQVQLTITADTTAPTIKGVDFVRDELRSEKQHGRSGR